MRLLLNRLLPAVVLLAAMLVLGVAVLWVTKADAPLAKEIPVAVQVEDGGADGKRVPVAGGAMRKVVATLEFQLPRSEPGHWLLWLPRDPLESIRLEGHDAAGQPWSEQVPGFFEQAPDDGFAMGGYAIVLPRGLTGEQRFKLSVRGAVRSAPTPRVLGLDDTLRYTSNELVFASAIYAAWATLLVAALALFWAVRDPLFLLYAQHSATALLFTATVNGHVYQLAWLGWLRGLGAPGFWAILLLFNAVALLTLLRFSDSGDSRLRWIRGLQRTLPLAVATIPFALLSLFWVPLQALVQPVATLAWSLAMPAAIAATLDGTRRGVPMAAATAAAMLLLLLASGIHEGMQRGWLEESFLARHGFQFALVLMSVILFVGSSSRLALVRRRLDDETSARRDSEHRLRFERLRAGFAQSLQDELRAMPADGIAPHAFRLLCGRCRDLLGVDDAVVLGHGYLDNELLLVQSDDRRVSPLAQAALVARGLLRVHAQSREPVHLRIDGARISDDPRAPHYAIVPMRLPTPAWAVLVLPVKAAEGLAVDDLHALVELARIAVTHAEEAHASVQLRKTAEYDALTGSLNRRSLDQALAREFKLAKPSVPLSVLFIDIDWFKRINDEHGHACGDHCLRSVATILRAELRPTDTLGRYGGEEFLVLLPGHDAAASRVIAERLRQAMERTPIEWNGTRLMLTISIGMAARRDGDGDATPLLERADKALYAAKREGRNRVCVAPANFI